MFEALATTSTPSGVGHSTGVAHDGATPSRAVRQSSLPLSRSHAARYPPSWTSTCRITWLPWINGELAKPHSSVGSLNAPTRSGPRSCFQSTRPSRSSTARPAVGKTTTMRRPSVAGVEFACVAFM